MNNRYKRLVAITLIVSILKPIISVIFILICKDKVTARIMGLAMVELAVYAGLFIEDMKRGKNFFDIQVWKYALSFNLPLIPHYLSMAVLSSSDRIMIQHFQGESETGIYSLAYSLSLIMTLFNNALLQTVEPWLYKKINRKEVSDISIISYTTLILIAVVNIALIAVAPEMVRIFAPPEYGGAVMIIPSVSMSVYFMYSYSLFASFEFYYEKTKYITAATLTGAVLNIVLNYVFIPRFGYYAAGYTTLFCYIMFAVMHYLFMCRVCKDNLPEMKIFDGRTIFTITVLFMGTGTILLITYVNNILRYCFLGILVFMAFIFRKRVKNSLIRLLSIKENRGK